MLRTIRLDHTNCLQVAIKTHSPGYVTSPQLTTLPQWDLRKRDGDSPPDLREQVSSFACLHLRRNALGTVGEMILQVVDKSQRYLHLAWNFVRAPGGKESCRSSGPMHHTDSPRVQGMSVNKKIVQHLMHTHAHTRTRTHTHIHTPILRRMYAVCVGENITGT
jgi:hypothetical protein